MAKAITLLESTRADHRAQADELLTALLPHTGKAFRLGISGVPGVGKVHLHRALGLYLIGQGIAWRCWRSTRPARCPAAPSWATRRAWSTSPSTNAPTSAPAQQRHAGRRAERRAALLV